MMPPDGAFGTYHREVALEIQPLTPERFADLAQLFGQGGDPKWCWCASFRKRGRDWDSSPAENRAILEAAVRDDAAAGRAPGLVAYVDGKAVGWASVGPRSEYERLAYSRVLAPVDDVPVWSIVCFVVGRRSRGQGVASSLLGAAVEYAREHGATVLEAYPIDTDGDRVASANLYTGTLGMFKRAGFEVVATRQANSSTRPRPIVRRALARATPSDA